MTANKSITERIFQAIGFELLAILICTRCWRGSCKNRCLKWAR